MRAMIFAVCTVALMVPMRVCRRPLTRVAASVDEDAISTPTLSEDDLLWNPDGSDIGHDYRRGQDGGEDVDETKVNELLGKRAAAQLSGEFEVADELRDELRREHSVDVMDRDLLWIVRNRWHSYERAKDDDGDVDVAAVDDLITRRVIAKRERDFDAADALREELKRMCVRVDDFGRSWSTTYGRQPRIESHDYVREADDDSDVDVDKVDQMLLDRLKAKFQRKFEVADRIRDELDEMGVRVDDAVRTWRAGLPARDKNCLHDYVRVASDDQVEVDIAVVDDLLLDRLNAKKRRDWDTADELRRQLAKLGVRIDDSKRTWTSTTRRTFTPRQYTRVESREEAMRGEPIEIDVEYVTNFIAERVEARSVKDFAKADTMLNDLLLMGVQINDREQTWRTISNYSYVGKPEALEGTDLEAINDLIGKRRLFKAKGKYDEGDEIKQRLANEHNVRLNDSMRTWTFGRAPKPPRQQDEDSTPQDVDTLLDDDVTIESLDDDVSDDVASDDSSDDDVSSDDPAEDSSDSASSEDEAKPASS